MIPRRIDDLDREGRRDLQRRLIRTGFLDPVRADGKPSDDGIIGPRTIRAYEQYWASRTDVEIGVPLVVPAPVKPWWATRRVIGLVVGLAGLGLQFAGYSFDADQATDLVLRGVELIGEVIAYAGAAISIIGAWRAKAPVDPTLVARVGGRDVRLPGRVRRNALPADPHGAAPSRPWPRRGPFDEGH